MGQRTAALMRAGATKMFGIDDGPRPSWAGFYSFYGVAGIFALLLVLSFWV